MRLIKKIIKNCFEFTNSGATFPYGEVASLFCISDNMLLKDMMSDSVLEINFSEIKYDVT